MENKFTAEQIEKAKACKSVGELLTLARENKIEITEAEARNYFAQLNPENGELADDELETVAGGCGDDCPKGGKHTWYSISNVKWNDQRETITKRCSKCGETRSFDIDGPYEGRSH